jgi:hypothetical protein
MDTVTRVGEESTLTLHSLNGVVEDIVKAETEHANCNDNVGEDEIHCKVAGNMVIGDVVPERLHLKDGTTEPRTSKNCSHTGSKVLETLESLELYFWTESRPDTC